LLACRYSRKEISEWLQAHDTSPAHGAVLPNKTLVRAFHSAFAMIFNGLSVLNVALQVPNTEMQQKVDEWLRLHPAYARFE
jgi:hypothetical protein